MHERFYHIAHIFIEKSNGGFWGWSGWTAIAALATAASAIVVAGTVIFIKRQTKFIDDQAAATKALTKFTVIPQAFFFLRSARTVYNLKLFYEGRLPNVPDDNVPDNWSLEEKLASSLIVKNNSKFPLEFYIKINFTVQGEEQPLIHLHWEQPLLIYPESLMGFPQIFELKSYKEKIDFSKSDKTIVGVFIYKYCPKYAKDLPSETVTEKWEFNLEKFEWLRSDGGIRDIGLALVQ